MYDWVDGLINGLMVWLMNGWMGWLVDGWMG